VNTPHGPWRPLARLIAVLCAVLLLQGCFTATGFLTVNPDETVDGAVTFGLNYALAKQAHKNDPTFDIDAWCAQQRVHFPELPSGIETPYRNEELCGVRIEYKRKPLSAFDGPTLVLKHAGDVYSFRFSHTPAKAAFGGEDKNTITVAVTLPGEITAASAPGTIDGSTVTWDYQAKPGPITLTAESVDRTPSPAPSPTEVVPAQQPGAVVTTSPTTGVDAIAEPEPKSSNLMLYIVAGAVVLLLVGAIAVVLLMRKPDPAAAAVEEQP